MGRSTFPLVGQDGVGLDDRGGGDPGRRKVCLEAPAAIAPLESGQMGPAPSTRVYRSTADRYVYDPTVDPLDTVEKARPLDDKTTEPAGGAVR